MKKRHVYLWVVFILLFCSIAVAEDAPVFAWERAVNSHWQLDKDGQNIHTGEHMLDEAMLCTVCGSEVWDYGDGSGDVSNYDTYGNLQHYSSFDADGMITYDSRHRFTYDENGALLLDLEYIDGVLYSEFIYAANADGTAVPVKQTCYNDDGTISTNEYDQYGNCVRAAVFDADGALIVETLSEYTPDDDGWYYEAKTTARFASGESFYVEHNQFSDPIREVYTYADGTVWHDCTFEYAYADGNKVWAKTYASGVLKAEYYYDQDGCNAKDIEYLEDGSYIITVYDENGDGTSTTYNTAGMVAYIADISKYGNLILDVSGADLFGQGYAYGDLLEVIVLDQVWELPLCSNYSDVDAGMPVLRANSEEEASVIAINMGDFATASGIALKTSIEEEPGYRWDYQVETPVQITIFLKQQDGYREQWLIHQLVRTNDRADYAHLSDEEFANFRMVDTTGMGANKLYRSSSPINPEIGRSVYADEATRAADIATVINLADASNNYAGTENTYYQTCRVVYLNLGLDITAPDFKSSLAEGLRFVIDNEAPYLIHCTEGKDRAGFVSALLECLMGATIDEVIEDYMVTYVNYYGVELGTEKYDAVVNSNLIKILAAAFRTEDIYTADLAAEAEAFLVEELGLSQHEVNLLKRKLGS